MSTFSPQPGRPRRWDRVQADPVLLVRAPGRDLEGLGPRHKPSYRLVDSLLYPLTDGPGVVLLIFVPPFLWVMSVPVFDLVAALAPRGEFRPLALLIIPFTLPLVSSFAMTLGYVVLYLGHVLVSCSMGEPDHPRFPEWDSHHILEGLGRMFWAVLVGLALGGFPALWYWMHCGAIDWVDRIVFADLVLVGVGYAQMALAAAMLLDNVLEANPLTALHAIWRIGWGYLKTCLVSGAVVMASAAWLWAILFRSPSMTVAAFSLWGFWVFVLYAAMVSARVLGLTYHRHAADLGWFRSRPGWASDSRGGRLYANS